MLRSQGFSGAGSVRTSVNPKGKAARLAKRRWGKATVMALLSAASLALPTAPSAGAADLNWTGDIDLNWLTNGSGPDTNWAGDILPDATSDVRFLGGTVGPITIGVGALANTVFSAENLTLTNGTLTLTTGTVTVDPGKALTFDSTSVIAGAGLTKLGDGTLILQGTNTYTGTTVVSAGVLNVMSNANLGNAANSVTLQNGATLQSTSATDFTVSRATAIGAGGGTIDVAGAGALTISGLVTGSTNITKTGSGVLALSGNNVGFSGEVNWTTGTLAIGNSGALGTSTADITVADGASFGVRSGTHNAAVTITRNINLAAGTTGGLSSVSTLDGAQVTGTYTGTVTLGRDLNVSTGEFSTTVFSGTVDTAAGTRALNKTGAGTVQLAGANIGQFTTTTVGGGALQFAAGTGNTMTRTGAVVNDGTIQATSGTVDFGTTVISSTNKFAGGLLREGRIGGSANNITTANAGGDLTTNTAKAQVPTVSPGATTPISGWLDNQTYVYSGQFQVAGGTPIQFGESFDDNVSVYIDGALVFGPGGYSGTDATKSAQLTLAAGWHNFELRLGQGNGGVGAVPTTNAPSIAWGPGGGRNGLGFGINLTGVDTIDGTQYLDFSAANVTMRALANQYVVDSGTTIKAGGITNGGAIIFNGATNVATTVQLAPASATTSDVEVLQAIGNGTNNVLNLNANATLDAASLMLVNTSQLSVTGSGTLNLGKSSDPNSSFFGGGAGQLNVNGGQVNIVTGTSIGTTNSISIGNGSLNSGVDFTIAGLTSQVGATGAVNLSGGAVMTVNTAIANAYASTINGTGGLTKAGAGSLTLTGVNTFQGPVIVTGGTLAFNSDAALGNAANSVTTSGAAATLSAIGGGTITSGRTYNLNATTTTVSVGINTTLDMTTGIQAGASNAVIKTDSGTLAISGPSAGAWNGGLTINGGVVRVSNATALGAATNPVTIMPGSTAVGSALQLSGGISIANPINLQGNNNQAFGGVNFGGQLQSVTGVNTVTGQLRMDFDAAIGADAGATLNINGGINNPTTAAKALIFTGAGTVNLNSSVTAATATANQYFSINKYGTGTLNVTTANPVVFTNNFTVFAGELAFTGAGTMTQGSGIALTVNPTGTLTLNNTGTAVANRLGGRGLTLLGANVNLIGDAAANAAETVGGTAFNRGHSVITVTAGAGRQADLRFGGLNNPSAAQNATTGPSGATALFRGTNLGAAVGAGNATIASTALVFAGQTGAVNTATKGILPWALVDTTTTGLGQSFATADSATGVIRPLAALEYAADNTLTANSNVRATNAIAATNTVNLNSITFAGGGAGGAITLNAGQSLTLSSGGILALAANGGISGGVLSAPTGNSPLTVHALANLNVTSTLAGGNTTSSVSLVKAGASQLFLNSPASSIYAGMSNNTLVGQTVVNQGTLKLSGLTNTLFANGYVHVGPGATLDLNGGAQYTQGLFTDSPVANGGGIVTTSTGTGTLAINSDARNWAGSIQGNVNVARTGSGQWTVYSPQTYTGSSLFNGNITLLRDQATILNTSSLAVTYGQLTIDNATGSTNLSDRVSNTAPITLRGGQINYLGRAQMDSTETLGAVTAAQGYSIINPSAGGTSTNSATLTLASMTQGATDATLTVTGTAANLGLLTSGGVRVFVTDRETTPGLTNNLIGGWAINQTSGDFLTYAPGRGVGVLGQTANGFANYDSSGTTFPTSPAATANVRLTAGASIPTVAGPGVYTINSLALRSGANFGFTTATNTLNLVSGGLAGTYSNNTIGTAVDNGRITSGGTAAGTTPLYVFNHSNTFGINSRVVDNGVGETRLVVSATGGAVSLSNGLNSFTGGLTVNGGTLNLNATSGVTVPLALVPAQGVVLNGAVVTMTNVGGQIDEGNTVTLNGNSTLNLFGTPTGTGNTLAGVVFNNTGGGSGNPTVNSGGLLTIGAAGVVATSSNVGSTSTLAGRTDFGFSGNTVQVDPILVNGI
ncbi:MAG TPA: autotransporter-associated beta strand repeat-containing protein, partial [Tepidisphaeraceae bacterium]|nr:autotransporter-associated beta strand repeat-containing protein [Tepidisphaeraceae bacterium]